MKWLRRGAQPSDTAKRLLSKSGILMKFEYEKLGKPMPGTEIGAEAEEVAKTDETEPIEAQETAPETGTLLTEETSDESAEEEE